MKKTKSREALFLRCPNCFAEFPASGVWFYKKREDIPTNFNDYAESLKISKNSLLRSTRCIEPPFGYAGCHFVNVGESKNLLLGMDYSDSGGSTALRACPRCFMPLPNNYGFYETRHIAHIPPNAPQLSDPPAKLMVWRIDKISKDEHSLTSRIKQVLLDATLAVDKQLETNFSSYTRKKSILLCQKKVYLHGLTGNLDAYLKAMTRRAFCDCDAFLPELSDELSTDDLQTYLHCIEEIGALASNESRPSALVLPNAKAFREKHLNVYNELHNIFHGLKVFATMQVAQQYLAQKIFEKD